MKPKTIVFVGPSAVGKTYIADFLMQKYPEKFKQARLVTTRKPRDGENPTDREFIEISEFQKLVDENIFPVYGLFSGNYYGFKKQDVLSDNKTLLVNAWPDLIPQFINLGDFIFVGMQAPFDWEKLLVSRMKLRGDNEETILKRLEQIVLDTNSLKNYEAVVNKSGKFFVIEDDKTIPDEILPWLEKELLLNS